MKKRKKKRKILSYLEFTMRGDFFVDTFNDFFPEIIQNTIPYPYDIAIIGIYLAIKFLMFVTRKSEPDIKGKLPT